MQKILPERFHRRDANLAQGASDLRKLHRQSKTGRGLVARRQAFCSQNSVNNMRRKSGFIHKLFNRVCCARRLASEAPTRSIYRFVLDSRSAFVFLPGSAIRFFLFRTKARRASRKRRAFDEIDRRRPPDRKGARAGYHSADDVSPARKKFERAPACLPAGPCRGQHSPRSRRQTPSPRACSVRGR